MSYPYDSKTIINDARKNVIHFRDNVKEREESAERKGFQDVLRGLNRSKRLVEFWASLYDDLYAHARYHKEKYVLTLASIPWKDHTCIQGGLAQDKSSGRLGSNLVTSMQTTREDYLMWLLDPASPKLTFPENLGISRKRIIQALKSTRNRQGAGQASAFVESRPIGMTNRAFGYDEQYTIWQTVFQKNDATYGHDIAGYLRYGRIIPVVGTEDGEVIFMVYKAEDRASAQLLFDKLQAKHLSLMPLDEIEVDYSVLVQFRLANVNDDSSVHNLVDDYKANPKLREAIDDLIDKVGHLGKSFSTLDYEDEGFLYEVSHQNQVPVEELRRYVRPLMLAERGFGHNMLNNILRKTEIPSYLRLDVELVPQSDFLMETEQVKWEVTARDVI